MPPPDVAKDGADITCSQRRGQGRVVFLGQTARRSLWRYLATRADGEDPDAPLFLGKGSDG